MNQTHSRAGYAKRIDASLRARYPQLITRIFEVEQDQFQIVFDAHLMDAESISDEFHESIRFVTVHVRLANLPPDDYVREIVPLSDEEATSALAGLPLRKIDLINLLVSRFPDAGIVDVLEDHGNQNATIFVSCELGQETQSEILDFVVCLDLPIVFRIAVSADRRTEIRNVIDDPMYIWASELRTNPPSYARNDEDFWFNNIAAISAGDLKVDDFPGMGQDVFRCYLDLSLADRHMNLRQALLLYDEVWCSLPLENRHDRFLEQQALASADLLHAVESGRLRFVTTQPEERLHLPFLEEVYERRPGAILGRRATAALLVADVAATADMSFLRDPSVVPAMVELAHMVSAEEAVPPQRVLRGFLWPLSSRRDALQGLLDRGSKAGPALRLAELIGARLQAKTGFDLELETLVFSETVHIGHALNATLLGPVTEPPAFMLLKYWIGRHLNFHRHFNEGAAASWLNNERDVASGVNLLPTLPLFEFDASVPISEILDDSGLFSVRQKGRGLYSRLAGLPEGERAEEVERLNRALRTRSRQRSGLEMTLDMGDIGMSIADLIMGLFVPPVSAIGRFSRPFVEKARRSRKIDSMMSEIQEKIYRSSERKELDFLSRVSRVATFRVDKV
ncbi:MAG: hypothetical protein OXQ29_19105 [Rhodospirillaceae bacterium]|nr:hypothetical protein [Rhodospirillaceae bacterium]